MVPNKVLFTEFLNQRGVHAYRGATQLCYVKPPSGYKDCNNSQWMMDCVMYLPFHWSVPDKDFKDILQRTIDAYKDLMKYLEQPHVPKPTHANTKELFVRAKL